MYPHQLREILPFLDWVGLDIKAPLLERDLYEKVVGKRVHIEKVEESLMIFSRVESRSKSERQPILIIFQKSSC